MFDTAPIRWLQSFDAESFIAFMQFVSLFGQQTFFVPLIIIVLFGIHRWKGMMLVEIVLWTVILTTILKELFALPRPSDVDSLVKILDPGAGDQSPFGFPSGHCSLTVVAWGTLWLLFRKRWLLIPGIFFVVLMPLSRMYLGRHFAGDVVGGTLLGFLVVGGLFVWKKRLVAPFQPGAGPLPAPGPLSEPTPGPASKTEEHAPSGSSYALFVIGLLVLPSILLFLPFGIHTYAGTLLGFGAGYLLGRELKGLDLIREPWKKGATVLAAVVIYVTAGWIFKEAVEPALGLGAASVQVLREFVVTTSMVWITPIAASLFFVRANTLR